jgi:hypothetical protein
VASGEKGVETVCRYRKRKSILEWRTLPRRGFGGGFGKRKRVESSKVGKLRAGERQNVGTLQVGRFKKFLLGLETPLRQFVP